MCVRSAVHSCIFIDKTLSRACKDFMQTRPDPLHQVIVKANWLPNMKRRTCDNIVHDTGQALTQGYSAE
jgi:hypothetical protein